MKYQKVYESVNHVSTVSLSEAISLMPVGTKIEDIKIVPVYSVQSHGGSELVGFKFVIYKPEISEF